MGTKGLTAITRKFVGKPYSLCGPGGLDCFGVIVEYLRGRGVAIPGEFRGRSTADYGEFFRSDPAGAKAMMVEFVSSLLDEISPTFSMAGDVLMGRDGKGVFLTVHGGNGMMVAATEERGVVPLPIRAFEILRAFRVPGSGGA